MELEVLIIANELEIIHTATKRVCDGGKLAVDGVCLELSKDTEHFKRFLIYGEGKVTEN
jgi:hypothetical protein